MTGTKMNRWVLLRVKSSCKNAGFIIVHKKEYISN